MNDHVDGSAEDLMAASKRPPWFILLPLVVIPCLGVIVPLFSEARGSGAADVSLRFRVLDADTSAPVASAIVRVQGDDRDEAGDRAETSPAGEAVIRRRFSFDFKRGSLVSRAREIVFFDRERVDASAPGYTSVQKRLSDLVGRSWDLQKAPFNRIAVVHLRRLP